METGNEQKSLKNSLASKGLYDDSTGKEQEGKILYNFLQRLQLGHCQMVPGERPDFTLNFSFNGQRASVGCEITCYFSDKESRGSAQARFVSQWKKFAKALRSKLDEEGQEYRYLYGAIHFRRGDSTVMDRFDKSALVKEIIFAVKDENHKRCLSDFNKSILPVLAEHVDHIYLKHCPPETGLLWFPSHLQSGILTDSTANLIEIVNRKNAIAHKYDWGDVAEKWLMIYGGADGIADTMGLISGSEIIEKLGKPCFDRVYVWDKFLETIYEVYPSFHEVFSIGSEVLSRGSYPIAVRPFILS